MPKVVDRSKWILLDHGRDQLGWIEPIGKVMYGAFRTRWRLPDGSERDWRERLKLGAHTMGVKAAERLLITKIKEFFDTHATSAGLPAKFTPDTTFAWLHIPIRDFGSVEMQDYLRGWLQELAADALSKSYIQHVLIYLRALNEAVKRQLVHFNYARELKLPARLKEVDQRTLSEDQVAVLIGHFRAHGQRRDALIITIFYTCALRPGELFALRWDDWREDRPEQLRIDEAFGKSGLDTPKTVRSRSHVYLPPAVQSELQAWKDWCGDIGPDAWIFTSKRGTPIAYDSYLDRTLRPAATACGIGEITHQMFRRTFSTVAIDSGASPKDVQGQMRHTQASMSL